MKHLLRISAVQILLFLAGMSLYAQENFQQEINAQVWKPFIRSFSSGDQKGFEAVHSPEIIRVIQDANIIWGHKEYFPGKKSSDHKPEGANPTIELRFIQRIASMDKAFEVGYYKTVQPDENGVMRTRYGKFHVVLRKEQGVWKILVDADQHTGATADQFEKAAALE